MTVYLLHAETPGVSLDLTVMPPRAWPAMSETERDDYMRWVTVEELQQRGVRPGVVGYDYCAILEI